MTIPWIPLFPDGNEPVTEVLGYPTSIITASSGREQRIRLREYPSREFTMRMVEMDARSVSRLLYALEQGHDFNAWVPFWPEAFQLTSDHITTDVTLNVDRTTERINWFGQYSQVLIWRGDNTVGRYTIVANAVGTIDVDPPLAEDWPAGTWVVPLWACKITAVGEIDRATDDAMVLSSLTARLDWGLGRRNPRGCEWIDALDGVNIFADHNAWWEETSLGRFGYYIKTNFTFPDPLGGDDFYLPHNKIEKMEDPYGEPWNESAPSDLRLWGSDAGDYYVGPIGSTTIPLDLSGNGIRLDIAQFVLFTWNDDHVGNTGVLMPFSRDVWRSRIMTGLVPGTKVGVTVKVSVLLNSNSDWRPFMSIVGTDTKEWSGHLSDNSFWTFRGAFYEPTVPQKFLSAIVPPSGEVEIRLGVKNMHPSGNIHIQFEQVEFAQCILPVDP